MDILPTIWFIAIAVLWIGYLLLEGFDLGVGHAPARQRPHRRRAPRHAQHASARSGTATRCGCITAGAATFAAFPLWYASLFSALYMPLVLVLLGLIFRAVAIEYRGKGKAARWAPRLGLGDRPRLLPRRVRHRRRRSP